jgi:hypothetical protein
MTLRPFGTGAFVAVLAFAIAHAAPAVMAQAGKASGKVTVDKTSVAISSVSAIGYKSAMGELVSVLVSDKPADAKAFAEDTRGAAPDFVPGIFSGAWKSQHATKRLSGLTFTVNRDGKILDEEILVGGKDDMFSIGSDEYVIELTSKSPRLAGRIRTKTPIVDVGRKVGIDVTFDAPVSAPPK